MEVSNLHVFDSEQQLWVPFTRTMLAQSIAAIAQTITLRTDVPGVTRQGSFVVPAGCREIVVRLGVAAGPGGGAGSPLAGHGGGGAGMGMIACGIALAVFPGEVLAYQIGGCGMGGAKTTASVATGTGVWTLPAGSVAPTAGQRVQMENAGGALPTGFSAGTQYFVVSPSGLTYKLAASEGGAPIVPTDTGTGVHHLAFSGAFGYAGAQPATRALTQANAETWIKRGAASGNRYLLRLQPGYPGSPGSSTGAGAGGGNWNQTSAGGTAPGGNGSTATQSPLTGVIFNGSTGAAGQASGTTSSGTATNAFGIAFGQRGGSAGMAGAGGGGPGGYAFGLNLYGWPEAQEAVGGVAANGVGNAGNIPNCCPGAGGAGGCGGQPGSPGEDGMLQISFPIGDVSGIVVRNLCTNAVISGDLIGLHGTDIVQTNRTNFTWDVANSRVLIAGCNVLGGQDKARIAFVNTGGGTLPTPLAFGSDYWLGDVDSTGAHLSLSKGGAAISLSGSGATANTAYNWKHPIGYPYKLLRTHDCNIRLAQIFPTSLASPDWTRADAIVAAAMAAGARVMFTLGSIPTWMASASPNVSDGYGVSHGGNAPALTGTRGADTGVYTELWDAVAAIVTRYNITQAAALYSGVKPIKYLETWNEPSFSGTAGGFWTGSAAELATLKRTAYRAAKLTDPAILVTDAGFSPSGAAAGLEASGALVQLNRASDGSGGTGALWMDAAVTHPYSVSAINNGEMIRALTRRMRHALMCAGRTDWATIPLIAGEGGPENDIAPSGIGSALLLARTIIDFGASGWASYIPFHHWLTTFLGDMTSDEVIDYLTWIGTYMAGQSCTVDLMGDGRYRVATPGATRYF